MTAPCGLPCFECGMSLASESQELKILLSELIEIPEDKATCSGCRNEIGKCAHLPVSASVHN